jgi:hypothetical protein
LTLFVIPALYKLVEEWAGDRVERRRDLKLKDF